MADNEVARINNKDIALVQHQHSEVVPIHIGLGEKILASGVGSVVIALAGSTAYGLGIIPELDTTALLVAAGTFGSAGGLTAAARANTIEFNYWLKKHAGLSSVPKTKGLWKTFLPFGRKLFPYVYQVEGVAPKRDALRDIRYSANHPINNIPVTYTIKNEADGLKVYHQPIINPMDKWDQLFLEETGSSINESRNDTVEFYKKVKDPTKAEILSARIAKSVNHIRNVETPLWVEEIASKQL